MREAVLLTYYDPDKIKSAFGDGKWLGMKLHYAGADQDLGTAGAVAHGATSSPRRVPGPLRRRDLRLRPRRDRRGSPPVRRDGDHRPHTSGEPAPVRDRDHRRRLEGAALPRKAHVGEVFSDTVNTGIYVLNAEALAQVPRTEPYDFARAVPQAARRRARCSATSCAAIGATSATPSPTSRSTTTTSAGTCG